MGALTGMRALVTCRSRGIGRAVERLARDDAAVVFSLAEAFDHAMAVTPRACSSPSGTPARGRADRQHVDRRDRAADASTAIYSASKAAAELAEVLDVSRAKVSNHLACLRGCGPVAATREGRQVRHELADQRLAGALRELARVVLDSPACPVHLEPRP
jgi:DNA-binding transcriptional ArsR family regulator